MVRPEGANCGEWLHININTSDEIIIQSIITLAHNLNLDIVAEGAENKIQVDFLKANHCAEVQGFYFSEAVTSDALEVLLTNEPTGS